MTADPIAGEHSGSIEFAGLAKGDEAPQLELHVLDRSGKALTSEKVDDRGRFSLKRKKLDEGSRVLIARADSDPKHVTEAEGIAFRARDFRAMLEEGPAIILGKRDWGRFLFTTQCVDGSVSRCYPYPWFIDDLILQAARAQLTPLEETALSDRRAIAQVEDALIASPAVSSPFLPRRCETICDGLVEVHRRTCCCRPWLIEDTRLLDLIHRLREVAIEFPKPPIVRKPGPGPDPAPDIGLIKRGTLDTAALRAAGDIDQIKALSGRAQIEYIEARPYLRPFWCSCGEPEKVGQGWIHSDGTFGICWREPLRFNGPGCHDEYAFVVRQHLGGEMVVIYDGPAANQWFDQTSGIKLVSHSRRAQGCAESDPPGTGAFAVLQDIGLVHSYQLKTPDASGWDSVAPPAYNDGLLNPVAIPAEAEGNYGNQNLGGTLRLRYHFSEAMKDAGAVYYRISVTEADDDGKPIVATRKALGQPLSWLYYAEPGVGSEGLGPTTVEGVTDLYSIPYREEDREWQSGQYHGSLPTADYLNGRHLLTLEVFDAEGKRLRPTGAEGDGKDADFEFRRWYQQTGPMAVVPYAGLTHMLWWDNRRAVALIEELYKDGAGSGAQCQFLSGTATSKLSVGYRAYHPEPLFILGHRMRWRRGLGGPAGILESSNVNASGPFPALPAKTNPDAATDLAGHPLPATFENMLTPETKCSFAADLWVNVKTTDGINRLGGLDGWDQAAFALEIATS